MKAVITTGGRVSGAYEAQAATQIKALAVTHGITMLQRGIDALRGCGVARIAVIGEPEVRAACAGKVEAIIDGAESGAQNVLRALRAWPEDDEPLLFCASDLPYIDATSLQTFLDALNPGTLAMPLADYEAFTTRFPEAPPFGITLAGKRVVNGGIFHIPPGAAEPLATVASRFFEARKSPWRMVSIAGPTLLLRFALKQLRVEDIEKRACELLGVPAVAVRNAPPELAFDADTADEFRYARDRW